MRLIIDANNMAYRARSSSHALHKKDGTDVTATYGVLRMLNAYIKPTGGGWTNHITNAVKRAYKLDTEPVVTDVFMCWDGGKSRYRRALYPAYKAQRDKQRAERTDEEKAEYYNFLRQMDALHDALPNLGVHSLKVQGWEADDLVHIVGEMLAPAPTVVISTDKDLLQLVDATTAVWTPSKEELITEGNFTAAVGLPHAQYLDYRVLVGDKSDNIDGIKGIGDKKAKALLMKYGSLGNALQDEVQLRKSVVTARMFDNLDIILRNIKLMDLDHLKRSTHYTDDGLAAQLDAALHGTPAFDDAFARDYLMQHEFVSLIVKFENFSRPFKSLAQDVRMRRDP